MLEDSTFDAGIELRRQMFGEAGADGQIYATTELNDKLQEIVTRWCFGEMWVREELPLKTRSMITVAMLLALGRGPELNIHMRGALANGVTDVELREIALHSILYCGIPAGVEGIRTLDGILADVAPGSALREDAARSGRARPRKTRAKDVAAASGGD
ncbi:carboxymuconolactone decarboxylase family protein [Dactylosporangium sp. CA-092794]|uniref:carboxymuconolactone decarboxylase family protein n=1 Tax=Dactylosporangium sp. CA-092794 TaxID=3239929 RepID=UPI003D8E3682